MPASPSPSPSPTPSHSPSPEPTVKLDIYYGQGGPKVRDDLKNSLGATTVANLNDTNGDGTVDKNEDEVSATPKGRAEIDLMKLVVQKPVPDNGGDVTLSVRSGDVKLWKYSTKTAPIDEQEIGTNTWTIPTGTLPKTFWIEARSPSSQVRDIELKLEYQGKSDTVHATAVWVQQSSRSPWCFREAEPGFPNNPVPGPGGQLPDLTDATCVERINITRFSQSGSRYGQGTHTKVGAIDTMYGGRILHEFEVLPPDVYSLGVRFDCTRQIKCRDYSILIGLGDLHHGGEDFKDFPDEPPQTTPPTPPQDNEYANDDSPLCAESNTPSHDRIYTFDAPGDPIRSTTEDFTAFRISRNTFRTWVRVKLKDMGGGAEPTFGADTPYLPQGSRASNKYEWHHVRYLKRVEPDPVTRRGEFIEDTGAVSCCTPRLEGGGNGTSQVTLLQNADTEGFTAIYLITGDKKKWTITGTSGGSASDEKTGDVPEGTVWTVTLGTRVTLTITQGSTAYATGAEYKFSVFKTDANATGGKKNETDVGSFDVTNGP